VDEFFKSLGSILACAGVGALIDFYIGKKGQLAIKSRLETWWIKLSYVRRNEFSQAEARFVELVLLKWFGKIFSVRRLLAIVGLAISSTAAFFLIITINFPNRLPYDFDISNITLDDYFCFSCMPENLLPISLAVSAGLFSISISLTLLCLRFVASRKTSSFGPNFTIFAGSLLVQIIGTLMASWLSMFPDKALAFMFDAEGRTQIDIEYHFIDDFLSSVRTFTTPPNPQLWGLLVYLREVYIFFPGVVRLTLSAIFVASYMLPLGHRFISLTIERFLENEKYFLTTLFSIIATVARIFQIPFS
jgi:hypothetical protein